MNPKQKEKIRIAVAEELGWLFKWTSAGCHIAPPEMEGEWDALGGEEGDVTRFLNSWYVPNYPESLDACSEFEAKLMESGQWVEYTENLGWVGVCPDRRIVASTPTKRCLAFLLTRGKDFTNNK